MSDRPRLCLTWKSYSKEKTCVIIISLCEHKIIKTTSWRTDDETWYAYESCVILRGRVSQMHFVLNAPMTVSTRSARGIYGTYYEFLA